jgi:peptidoglycan/LPS O-acetylase OafA/YrhL
MHYRREIDGLRAVAVVPVILYHAGFDAFRGGFVGVDVFFVISGYLITSIIYEEAQKGSFSILRFYERRIRRILPALYLVMFTCIPFAWLWMLPSEMKDFAKSIVAVNIFSSNILFWRSISYFSPDIESFPLVHTWSLSVEEQFYVFFPLLLTLCARLNRIRLISLLLVLSALSLSLSEWTSRTHPAFDFYLLPTRAWELGIGAIIAINPRNSFGIKRWVAEAASFTGLLMLVYAILFFDTNVPFPSLWAFFPVGGAALLIVFATQDTACGKLLGLKPFVGIGLISYSAYLWHQPLFAFARIRLQSSPTSAVTLFLCVATFCLAYVSWRFVELPFRDRRRFSMPFVFSNMCMTASVLFAFGLVVYIKNGLPSRYSPEVAALAVEITYDVPRATECFGDVDFFIHPNKSCVYNPKFESRVAIMGDSHSAAIASELAEALRAQNFSLQQFSFSGCPPIRGIHFIDLDRQLCPTYNDLVFSYIKSHAELVTIILFARWPIYMNGYGYDNGEGGGGSGGSYLLALPSSKGAEFINDPARIGVVGSIFRASIEELMNMGKRVVLVYPTPEIGRLVPSYLTRNKLFGNFQPEPLSVSFTFFQNRTRTFRDEIDRLPDNANLLRIRPEETFCNKFIIGRCLAESAGKPLYFDDNHLNNIGSSMLSRQIIDAMKQNGWL